MARLTRQQDVTILELGTSYHSLDEKTLEHLGEILLSQASFAEPPRLVLDLSQTEFIGSRFVELLVRAWKRIKSRNGSMALCGVRPFCADVLRVSRLDTLWNIYPTQAEAVAGLSSP
ncbi:MAG: STAS domain-containing protein [Thermoguttaceae bacterium]